MPDHSAFGAVSHPREPDHGPPTSGGGDAFQPALFNTLAYAALHAGRFPGPPLRCMRRLPGTASVRGVFQSVPVAPGHHVSPGRAPHGGFDMAADATTEDLAALVATAEAALHQHGTHTLDIVQPPLCHAPAQGAASLGLLCRLGYVVTRQELNQALPVDDRPFAALGAYATRKRLAKARRLGVSTMRLAPAQHRAAYDVLDESRAKKGRSLSMSWDDVARLVATFPDRVFVFGAMQCDQLIAAAITVAVTGRVLYVHAWGERQGAEPASPVTLLAEHIHGFAAAAGFGLLDLGTSTENGVVNPGLYGFKTSLGATASLKLWLRRELRP